MPRQVWKPVKSCHKRNHPHGRVALPAFSQASSGTESAECPWVAGEADGRLQPKGGGHGALAGTVDDHLRGGAGPQDRTVYALHGHGRGELEVLRIPIGGS